MPRPPSAACDVVADALQRVSDEQLLRVPASTSPRPALWHPRHDYVSGTGAGGLPRSDDAWAKRLGVSRRDFGIGMSSPEVTELSRQIDLGALREYRDAVGRATREIVGGFKPEDWTGEVSAESIRRAADQGAFGVRTDAVLKAFTARPRGTLLSGIAIFHPAAHMGEASTVRTAGGFGTGV